MKKLVVAALLIPSLASGAGWDETNSNPDPSDTVMINDTSQPEGSKTQYTAFGNFPVSTPAQNALDTKVGLAGDETVAGVKTFTSSPIVPEPTADSQAATKYYVDNNGGGGGPVAWGAITGTLSDQGDLNTALLGKVNTTGSENINGVKTFLLPPIVPTPANATDATNKAYVDSAVGGGGSVVWGGIGGILGNQADLQQALDNKAPSLTADQNYVTNAEKTTLSRTSGFNTGDQDISNFVDKTSAETISGVKTFTSSPSVPTPVGVSDAVPRAYADTKAPQLTADQNYVSNAEKTILGNTSGTNSGDQDLSVLVSKTGNESIQGIKTFMSSPIVPTPFQEYEAATKAYVDSKLGSGGGIPEAPSDGAAYGRADAAWEPVQKTADVDVVEEGLSLTMDRTPAGTDADPWILNVKGALTATADQYFGTNAGSTLGFYDLPEGGSGGSGYVATPTYSDETCTTGQRSFDASYIYICEATDQWDRYAVTWLDWSNPTPTVYEATVTVTDDDATGDTFTLNSVAFGLADSPYNPTDLPTATEDITYVGTNTAACTGDVTGSASPWTITQDNATVSCSLTEVSGACSSWNVTETIFSDSNASTPSFGNTTARTNVGFWFRTSLVSDMVRLTVQMKSAGTPTGDVMAYLYTASDQGTSPNGSPSALLATATPILASSIGAVQEEFDFDFDSTTLAADTNYWMVLERSVIDATNVLVVLAGTNGNGRLTTSENKSSWSYGGTNNIWMEIKECAD